MNAQVIVWDRDGDAPDDFEVVLAWRSFVERPSVASVPRYLEEHADRLKAKYLEFIHDLGDRRLDGKRIVEHLDTGTGFSFWWMTHLAEKSPFKSPRIYDSLRLLALEGMLLERHPSRVELVSGDRVLARAVRVLCDNLTVAFSWTRVRAPHVRWSARRAYRALPHAMQGVVSLAKYLVTRWPLRSAPAPRWFAGSNAVFMGSYFFNLDSNEGDSGRFYSRQWEEVPRLIHATGRHTNWLQHFLPEVGPDARSGLGWLRHFNRDADREGSHAFLESHLSWPVVRQVVRRLLWLRRVARDLRNVSEFFRPAGSAVSLWPMLERDWWTSLKGPTAISNCLWVELFDTAFGQMPPQTLGLYLCENQGWERAMLDAWRRHGHGEIIGVAHATVPFWHLNYFDDPRTLQATDAVGMPLPDRVALNGPMAWRSYVHAGYPAGKLAEVEAMRYQYLAAHAGQRAPTELSANSRQSMTGVYSPRRVLVLGDISRRQTVAMLGCIGGAISQMGEVVLITLKPHPASHVTHAHYPGLAFELTDRPLADIIGNFDVAFSSNTTSAGIDALLAGLPVAVFLDASDFNLSPLRGVPGVHFVTTSEQLAHALGTSAANPVAPAAEEFFWLDATFPRWRRLLAHRVDGL